MMVLCISITIYTFWTTSTFIISFDSHDNPVRSEGRNDWSYISYEEEQLKVQRVCHLPNLVNGKVMSDHRPSEIYIYIYIV